jgi:uroporphyrinogen III methyltransferase/synthase
MDDLAGYDWLMFTSTNGVEHFFDRLFTKGFDTRRLGTAKIAAIGAATAQKLREYGIIADVVPVEFRAEGIIEAVKDQITAGMKILIPRAQEAREVLPEKLCELGAVVTVVPVYQTIEGDLNGQEIKTMLKNGEIDLVTFTSSSTVKNLLNILGIDGSDLVSQVKTACIGPITAQTCLEHKINPAIVAETYTIAGLVEAIKVDFSEKA